MILILSMTVVTLIVIIMDIILIFALIEAKDDLAQSQDEVAAMHATAIALRAELDSIDHKERSYGD